MFKRIGLFVLTNLAILVMLSIILNLVSWFFGVNFGQIAGSNQNYATLLIFAAVIGFTGSLISLFMSKTMAKTSMGLQMIDVDNPRNGVERWLVETVAKLAKIKGVAMPEVGIYHGEPNAFATGPSRNNSLVAVSDGLLASMNREEVEAVLGHEMSHVANGDMVTMTLMQGVINTFVVFLSRVIGNIVDRGILRNESDAPGAGYYITSFVLDMVLGLLGSMLVMAFSRYREYRADAGAAEALGSPVPMINALARLGGQPTSELPGAVKGFGINGGIGSFLFSYCFSSRLAQPKSFSLRSRFERNATNPKPVQWLWMSFLTSIPSKQNRSPLFSGKRIKRVLYRSKKGLLINADINGAANIARKELGDEWLKTLLEPDRGVLVDAPAVVRNLHARADVRQRLEMGGPRMKLRSIEPGSSCFFTSGIDRDKKNGPGKIQGRLFSSNDSVRLD